MRFNLPKGSSYADLAQLTCNQWVADSMPAVDIIKKN